MLLILSGILTLPALVATVYGSALLLLGLPAFMTLVPRRSWPPPRTRFAIVIPAHDEEHTLRHALQSCIAIDYPPDLFHIFVVADNCSDRTAEVARGHSDVSCLERHDHERRGKGYALTWAFTQIPWEKFDAVVILDADCRMTAPSLRAFDSGFRSGARLLQARVLNCNPDASPISYAVSVGKTLETDFFDAPKSRIGLPVFLRGTGMAIHRDVLAAHPWDAHSVTEDKEYSIALLRRGIRVCHVPDASVVCDAPQAPGQLSVQRLRWSAGLFGGPKLQGLRLLWDGVRHRNPWFIDAGLALLVASRPLVLLCLLLSFTLACLNAWIDAGAVSRFLFFANAAIIALQATYFATGIVAVGITRRRMTLLARCPGIVALLAVLSVVGFVRARSSTWRRTPRVAEQCYVREETRV